MSTVDEKKKAKLAEMGLDTEKYGNLAEFLLKNWPTALKAMKIKHSNGIFGYIVSDFFYRGWIKTKADLNSSVDIGAYLMAIAQKHFGDREYDKARTFNFDFLSPAVTGLSDFKLVVDVIKQSESPFDLFQNGLKSVFKDGLVKSTKDIVLLKKIVKSAGHNSNSIFTFAIPILAKYRIISSVKDLDSLLKTLLDICNLVKYPENVLRDLEALGEKSLIRDKQDLELLRDVLKVEKDEWKAQQKFYQLLNLANLGKIRFSIDLKKYLK